MKLNLRASTILGIMVASSTVMFGDSINVADLNSGSIWQTWSASQVSNQGWMASQTVANQPYWNNNSWDGVNQNVGGCLAVASSGCALAKEPGALPYLGQADGKAFSNFYFSNTGSVSVTLESLNTAAAANEVFGWYNINNLSQYQILISGQSSSSAAVTFTPSAEYGLFFYDATSGLNDVFATNSALNSSVTNLFSANPTYNGPADADIQHFAVFQQSAGNYYVGIEDVPAPDTDFDYNDMIVKLSTATTATPEPGSMLLIGAGFVGLGAFRLRRKAGSKQA